MGWLLCTSLPRAVMRAERRQKTNANGNDGVRCGRHCLLMVVTAFATAS